MQTSQEVLARREFERVTTLVPGEAAGWANLGLLLMRQQDMQGAAAKLAEAEKLAPGSAAIQRLMGAAREPPGPPRRIHSPLPPRGRPRRARPARSVRARARAGAAGRRGRREGGAGRARVAARAKREPGRAAGARAPAREGGRWRRAAEDDRAAARGVARLAGAGAGAVACPGSGGRRARGRRDARRVPQERAPARARVPARAGGRQHAARGDRRARNGLPGLAQSRAQAAPRPTRRSPSASTRRLPPRKAAASAPRGPLRPRERGARSRCGRIARRLVPRW